MGKSTMSFLSKLLGKKKDGCCGVVFEEIDPGDGTHTPVSKQEERCCGTATGTESESNDT